jgi:hypothetical protein
LRFFGFSGSLESKRSGKVVSEVTKLSKKVRNLLLRFSLLVKWGSHQVQVKGLQFGSVSQKHPVDFYEVPRLSGGVSEGLASSRASELCGVTDMVYKSATAAIATLAEILEI